MSAQTGADKDPISAALSKPGFGWASPPPSRCVVHEATVRVNMDGEFGRNAKTLAPSSTGTASSTEATSPSVFESVDPPYSHAMAGELLNALSSPDVHVDPERLAIAIEAALRNHFIRDRDHCDDENATQGASLRADLDEFTSTGRSNGRAMKWHLMRIAPNTSFKLHAHPNIELIYVIRGTMHEIRLHDSQIPRRVFAVDEKEGPPLDGDIAEPLRFRHRSTSSVPNSVPSSGDGSKDSESTKDDHLYSQSRFLINERGSIHLTYTLDDGAELLVLWSGGHANIPPARLPRDAATVLKLPPEVLPF